MILSGNWMFTK